MWTKLLALWRVLRLMSELRVNVRDDIVHVWHPRWGQALTLRENGNLEIYSPRNLRQRSGQFVLNNCSDAFDAMSREEVMAAHPEWFGEKPRASESSESATGPTTSSCECDAGRDHQHGEQSLHGRGDDSERRNDHPVSEPADDVPVLRLGDHSDSDGGLREVNTGHSSGGFTNSWLGTARRTSADAALHAHLGG